MTPKRKPSGKGRQQVSYHDRIIIWGMSCVGKTTFAQRIAKDVGSEYVCFDAHFPWHTIETLDGSPVAGLGHLSELCSTEKCIVDGWHLSGADWSHFPEDYMVYVLVAPYDQIIDQYRVPVDHRDQHLNMFKKWRPRSCCPSPRYPCRCDSLARLSRRRG